MKHRSHFWKGGGHRPFGAVLQRLAKRVIHAFRVKLTPDLTLTYFSVRDIDCAVKRTLHFIAGLCTQLRQASYCIQFRSMPWHEVSLAERIP
jgi:hypothetical protein